MEKKLLVILFSFCAITFVAKTCFAETLTLDLAKLKVKAAAKLIEEKGEAAFPELRDPAGEFRFGEGKGYIWVHDLSGKMLMHPTQPELEGTNMLDYKDSSGFAFFISMNEIAKKYGEGWVVYLWPKPGKKIEELKSSYVILAKNADKEYVVGCGMYNVNKEYIKSLYPRDIIYSSENSNEGL